MLPKERRKELPADDEKPRLLEQERIKFFSEFDDERKQLEQKLLAKDDQEYQGKSLEDEEKEENKIQKKQGVS
ncbi:unnamed protein product [Nippostrongylus brasiliensis]|uniref:FAM192A_Fyv6_N domain-containing protein n=1 Tax=Nippostrongylus brasiliensis TaxID=27835 RepID=A0A0N4YL59_NIPBR|nr:unnamed protein product [Nippostrongylus brasiliensis]